MGVQTYSARQRRAVNLIWAAAGEYGFEPKFLAMKTDGTPDFYMNFVIGLVYKWFGRDMLERLFDSWLGDVRQAVMDDLAWLALEYPSRYFQSLGKSLYTHGQTYARC